MTRALIVGQGIAGLALACGLAREGVESTVLEAVETPQPIGAGLQLGPNAVRALEALGFAPDDVPGVVAPEALVVRDAGGRQLMRKPLGAAFEARFGAPYRVVHRGALWSALRARAVSEPAVTLVEGVDLETIHVGPDGAELIARDGRRWEAPVLVGADGLRSQVREAMLGAARHATHGLNAWRATVPIETPDTPVVALTFAPDGGHTVHYPLDGGTVMNLVVIAPARPPFVGSWIDAGRPSDLLSLFGEAMPPHLGPLLKAAPSWVRWPLLDRDVTSHWGHGPRPLDGPATLIGDAAHPALPFLAQGGAMALEDAAALAGPLAAALKAGDPPAATLRAIETARHPRTARLVEASRSVGRAYHMAPPMRLARDVALRLAGPALTGRYDWLYRA